MPVLVLGMHRSGTSVLTKVVSLLGVDVGDDDVLMGPSASNRSGHWEVTPLTELNDDLLRHLGGRWSGPPAVTGDQLRTLAHGPWGERARKALDGVFGTRTGDWVWKDPRLCVLGPFWREVLSASELRAVVVVRHPSEVARSLEARNGIGIDYGVALWERYHRSALASATGLSTLVVSYDELCSDPVAVAHRLDDLVPGGPGRVDEAEIRAAVTSRERHHVAGGDEVSPPAVARLFTRTLELLGRHDPLRVELPAPAPGLQLAFDEHARMGQWHDLALQYRPLVDEALELRAALDEAHAEREQLLASRTIRTWLRLRGRLPRT